MAAYSTSWRNWTRGKCPIRISIRQYHTCDIGGSQAFHHQHQRGQNPDDRGNHRLGNTWRQREMNRFSPKAGAGYRVRYTVPRSFQPPAPQCVKRFWPLTVGTLPTLVQSTAKVWREPICQRNDSDIWYPIEVAMKQLPESNYPQYNIQLRVSLLKRSVGKQLLEGRTFRFSIDASLHEFGERCFQFSQIGQPLTNIREMAFADRPHVVAMLRGIIGQIEQRTNVADREAQIAAATDEA